MHTNEASTAYFWWCSTVTRAGKPGNWCGMGLCGVSKEGHSPNQANPRSMSLMDLPLLEDIAGVLFSAERDVDP